jgi:hypothetical protein
MKPARLVADPELSPLDLVIAPNGNIVGSNERPFGALDAVTGVREYDSTDGHHEFSLQMRRQSSVNRAACASLPMDCSTASPLTMLLASTLLVANAWGPSCVCHN